MRPTRAFGVVVLAGAGIAVAAGATGCVNPGRTQLPTVAPGPPAAERRSLERFDPYPDRTLGPETFTRPSEFRQGRAPQRQAAENRLLQGTPTPAAPPGYSTGAYRDPDVVR